MEVFAVVNKERKSRKGKGFSRGELKEAGLGIKHALHQGIPIDPRRSTTHNENVKTLNACLGMKATMPAPQVDLTEIEGIGPKRSEQLKATGVRSLKKLAESKPKQISEKLGVSEKRAARWIKNAKKMVATKTRG